MTTATDQVSVTTKSTDLLFVQILNEELQYESFDYLIYGQDKSVLRRGTFRAPSVQIRTTYMNEGTYQFQLLFKGQEWKTTLFEKHRQEA